MADNSKDVGDQWQEETNRLILEEFERQNAESRATKKARLEAAKMKREAEAREAEARDAEARDAVAREAVASEAREEVAKSRQSHVETPTVRKQPASDFLSNSGPGERPVSKDVKTDLPMSLPFLAESAKRQLPASAFKDDRRGSVPKTSKEAALVSQKSSDSTPGAGGGSTGVEGESIERQPPEWYRTLKTAKLRRKDSSNVDTVLSTLRDCITKVKTNEVRERLHKLQFLEVTPALLRFHRMLHNDSGLPKIFDGGVDWPWDIKADAEEQYNKWCLQIFEIDMLRGIDTARDTARLDTAYKKNKNNGLLVEPKEFGNGRLINGTWWPLQICAVRDGAHRNLQGGIAGVRGDGAHSILLSGSPYEDIDNGDEIFYCGTKSENGEVSEYTQRMIESVGNRPVRVLRSSKILAQKSKYRPEIGLRYDGLYDVTGFEVLDKVEQVHRFHLVRVPGQPPIRGGNGPEKRPTQQEIQKFKEHKKLSGSGG